MNQKKTRKNGSIKSVFVIFGIVAIVSVLGFIVWNNFFTKDGVVISSSAEEPQPLTHKPCGDGEDERASVGVFCSEIIGVKLPIPAIFKGKIEKSANYEVYEGPVDPSSKVSAGRAENVFTAKLSGNDTLSLVIAQEPLRTGYIDVYHLLRQVYFDKSTGILSSVNTPVIHYDSATGTTTSSGSFSLEDPVPSVDVNGVRLFKATSGDAGLRRTVYVGVIKGKLVKIQLEHQAYMGNPAQDPSTVNPDNLFDEFYKEVEKLELI